MDPSVPSFWKSLREAYGGLPREAWFLAGVQLVNMCGSMVIFFLTLYLTRALGFSVERAGLAMSGYGLGMLGGGLAGGTLSDRLGAFRVQRLSLLGSASTLAALPFFRGFPVLFAGIVAIGFFASALWPANAAAMAALCPDEVRAKGFVLNRLANNLGITIGPVVGGILAQHDYRLLFYVDGSTCLAAALVLFWIFPASRAEQRSPEARAESSGSSAWTSDRIFLVLLLTTAGAGLIFSQLFSTYGPYVRFFRGFPEPLIGRLIAVNTLLIVIFQMPITHSIRRHSGVRMAALGALALALGFGLMPWGRSFAFLAGTVAIWTIGEMLLMPSLTTLTSLRAPAGAQGRYMGLHSLGFSVGITLGPTLSMRLLKSCGGLTLWSTVAGLGLGLALLCLGLSREWDGK